MELEVGRDEARRPDGGAMARGAADADPAVGLRAVRALGELADRLESLQVGRARALGWSWQQIAETLGVSRQAVHQKHRCTPVPRLGPDGHPGEPTSPTDTARPAEATGARSTTAQEARSTIDRED